MNSNKAVCAILEDYDNLRDIYSGLISHEQDMEVLFATGSPDDLMAFLATPEGHQVRILLLDIELDEPDSGIRVCREVRGLYPEIRIIMLTCHEEEDKVLASFEAGATDYILKENSFSDLLETIRRVDRGEGGLHDRAAQVLRKNIRDTGTFRKTMIDINRSWSELTATEREILRLLYKGLSQKEIAETRHIELITVKTHVSSILRKFKVRSSRQVVKRIREAGLEELIL